jgi:hypothetical protein
VVAFVMNHLVLQITNCQVILTTWMVGYPDTEKFYLDFKTAIRYYSPSGRPAVRRWTSGAPSQFKTGLLGKINELEIGD